MTWYQQVRARPLRQQQPLSYRLFRTRRKLVYACVTSFNLIVKVDLSRQRFQASMVGFAQIAGQHKILEGRLSSYFHPLALFLTESYRDIVYPWGKLPEGATICDVGGGNGSYSLEIVKRFSRLSVIVQDLQAMKDDAVKVLQYSESVRTQ